MRRRWRRRRSSHSPCGIPLASLSSWPRGTIGSRGVSERRRGVWSRGRCLIIAGIRSQSRQPFAALIKPHPADCSSRQPCRILHWQVVRQALPPPTHACPNAATSFLRGRAWRGVVEQHHGRRGQGHHAFGPAVFTPRMYMVPDRNAQGVSRGRLRAVCRRRACPAAATSHAHARAMPAPRCQPSLLLAGSPVPLPLRGRKAWLVRDAGMYWCGRFWVDRIDADASLGVVLGRAGALFQVAEFVQLLLRVRGDPDS